MVPKKTKGFIAGLSCYVSVRHYQKINIEVLSENPILFIFRELANEAEIAAFIEDVHNKEMAAQVGPIVFT